jgi:hypothetical protein
MIMITERAVEQPHDSAEQRASSQPTLQPSSAPSSKATL